MRVATGSGFAVNPNLGRVRGLLRVGLLDRRLPPPPGGAACGRADELLELNSGWN